MDAKGADLSRLTGWAIVVEDYEPLRVLIVEMLADIDIQSQAFETADDALIFLLQTHGGCPLVIVDQGLPGQLQGIEFIDMVRERWPATSAILISGYDLEPAMVPSSTIYLQKPWTVDALVNTVTSLLQPDDSARQI